MARRIVLGERAAGDYGLFVSKPGEDANSSDALSFDSNSLFTFGLHSYGQGSLAARSSHTHNSPSTLYSSGSSSDTRIAHGLGYAPQVFLRWCYSDEIFTNPSGYPSGSYGVTTLTPGKVTSTTNSSRFESEGGIAEPVEFQDMNNQCSFGIDFEVDSSYLYISSYEFGLRAQTSTNQSIFNISMETKFSGLTIYYAYIITVAPDNGLKL